MPLAIPTTILAIATLLGTPAFAQTAPIGTGTPIAPGPPTGTPNAARPSTDAQIAHQLLMSTPEKDLPNLAICDKKYVLHYAPHAESEKFFAVLNGKREEFFPATVIFADANSIHLAVCTDAQKSHTADFLFKSAHPLTEIPTPGDTLTLAGTYTSYTSDPPRIILTNLSIIHK